MEKLEVLHFPDERLRIVAEPVDKVDDNIRKIVDQMFYTMYEEMGIGLAATQVNIHKRIIVIDISGEENINALYEYHIWSKKFPINRLSWKPSHPLKLMIIRAYRMQSTVLMPVEDSYKGCKSWVDFSREIDVSDVTPAVADAEFHNRINTIYDALNINYMNG